MPIKHQFLRIPNTDQPFMHRNFPYQGFRPRSLSRPSRPGHQYVPLTGDGQFHELDVVASLQQRNEVALKRIYALTGMLGASEDALLSQLLYRPRSGRRLADG